MKYIILIFLLINPLNFIGNINRLQKEAGEAFQKKDYLIAILKYNQLIDNYELIDDKIYLNLAHCYYLTDKHKQANYYYLQAIKTGGNTSKSLALNQLACIEYAGDNYEDALNLFKEAILNDPLNYKARYNYELLKKKLDNKSSDNNTIKDLTNTSSSKSKRNTSLQTQIKKDKQSIIKENEATENQEASERSDTGDKKKLVGDQKSLQPEKLEEIKINKDKAEAILEALKNQEIQYIQQLRRRPLSKKSSKKTRKQW